MGSLSSVITRVVIWFLWHGLFHWITWQSCDKVYNPIKVIMFSLISVSSKISISFMKIFKLTHLCQLDSSTSTFQVGQVHYEYKWLVLIITMLRRDLSVLNANSVDTDQTPHWSWSILVVKKGKRKVQGVLQSQTAALPRHQEENETDKSKQIEQTYEKH